MLSASAIAEAVRNGSLSPQSVIEDCLTLIDALDERLEAWVHIDRQGVRSAATARAEMGSRGPLAGVPIGIKDIYDVAGLPTALGAGAFAHYLPEQDATAVRRLREAGALILGKTATTAFAFIDPAPTHNPWNLEHTPGGSSSGSAAAVAAGMIPVALGSQTVGSILRPAAYCGIVGLKPTFGRVSLAGVHPLAEDFDHAGIFSRSVADAALVLNVVAGHDALDRHSSEQPVPDYVEACRALDRAPVLGLPRRYYREAAGEEVREHMEQIASLLTAAGATVREIELSADARAIREMGEPILRSQAANAHARLFSLHAAEYPPHIRALVEAGQATTQAQVMQAQEACRRLQDELVQALSDIDAILIPAAPTTAPAGLQSTGDGTFCAPASFTGLPAIALPSGLGESGLPLSIQLVGWPFTEGRLLGVASWIERVIGFQAEPDLTAP